MTVSGVGKCRQVTFILKSVLLCTNKLVAFMDVSLHDNAPLGQVGISESGIDDAVQKLISRG